MCSLAKVIFLFVSVKDRQDIIIIISENFGADATTVLLVNSVY